ncbi:MAG: prephenate dehydrogenase/arogenate dehydrogenase family protein [Polyangiaceae bacterium]|nr:prephenate dehydrogenase/arogenate dehydrogenase family protein [Polyangiaceae bacterium]
MKHVVVIGLGLMGASLGLGLRKLGVHVTGLDLPEALTLAALQPAADTLLSIHDRPAAESAFLAADLTVLAPPVSAIMALLPWVLDHAPVVTDAGSTKRWISESVSKHPNRARFVPGHPMAGLPGGGAANARADLFVASNWLLCPELSSSEALGTTRQLVSQLGAHPVEMSAAEHDAAVALTSHLPQLLGSCVKVLAHQGSVSAAAGPSFERLTRAAGGAENIWKDIFASNGDEVARVLRQLCARLEPLAEELERGGEARKVLELLSAARALG